jgi:hypothetical protein
MEIVAETYRKRNQIPAIAQVAIPRYRNFPIPTMVDKKPVSDDQNKMVARSRIVNAPNRCEISGVIQVRCKSRRDPTANDAKNIPASVSRLLTTIPF